MKIRLSLFCIALAIIACNTAGAQIMQSMHNGASAQSAYQPVQGDLLGPTTSGIPGRLWFETNLADQGLGWSGTYFTIGGKTRLFEDRFDGRWLLESQIHYNVSEGGGAFANIGVERVFSIPAAQADVSFGLWYDYSGDRKEDFSHTFHQVGISGKIKKEKWDLLVNGYFPTGVQDYSYGDPLGIDCFVGNEIVIIPGIDSALSGFDVTLRTRPKQLAGVNGFLDIGGYSYNSDLINSFGGGKVRLGFQGTRGMMVNLEVNQDDRFNTTGVVGLGWVFGANAGGRGSEYAGLGRDLETSVRNDHIVVFNQDVVLAMDPTTGAAYNVIHVDNNADASVENGTAERPYSTLLLAQNLSAAGDVILVNSGDGTDRNMDAGVQLQDNQRLWGNGQAILIPIQNGQFFELCTNPLGVTPTISNAGGFAVVTLANNNDVAGINIDATGAQFGVFGNGQGTSVRDNTISGADSHGIFLSGVTGDVNIARNLLDNNDGSGLFIRNALDTNQNITIEENVASNNFLDGIQMRNYDPASLTILSNSTDNNLRSGLHLENYANTTGAGFTIQSHTSTGNASHGVHLNQGLGSFTLLDSNITENNGAGLLLENWQTANPDVINIATTEGGTSTISNNGAFANIQIFMNNGGDNAMVNIANQTLSGGVRGVAARIEGVDGVGARTTLGINIASNNEIDRNVNDGINLSAVNSGLIQAMIGDPDSALPMTLLDNAVGGGNGISLVAQGINGQPQGEIQASIQNMDINNAISRIIVPGGTDIIVPTTGILVDSSGNALVGIDIADVTIGAPGAAGDRTTQRGIAMDFSNNGSELINRVGIDDVTIFSNTAITLDTGFDTYTDLTVENSTLRSNGPQSVGGRADNTPFVGGPTVGIDINAQGRGSFTGQFNAQLPNLPLEYGLFTQVSDGDLDNLTKVTLENNSIRDFVLNGVDISAQGDAQMLVEVTGNDISNNGAGGSNHPADNPAFPLNGTANVDELFYLDGLNIDALDDSTISTNIVSNFFVDNFERGVSLNTFNSATINAFMDNNTFFGNDRGSEDYTLPRLGTGIFEGPRTALNTAGEFAMEAINNEEFYIRDYESRIFVNGNGDPALLSGADLPADTPGIFFPINTGNSIFGFPVALGTADLNLSMTSNALQLPTPDFQNFAVLPGNFTLGLDGLTNGFTGPFFNVSDTGFGAAIVLIGNEEAFFTGQGF
jgi:hypothetical protein